MAKVKLTRKNERLRAKGGNKYITEEGDNRSLNIIYAFEKVNQTQLKYGIYEILIITVHG